MADAELVRRVAMGVLTTVQAGDDHGFELVVHDLVEGYGDDPDGALEAIFQLLQVLAGVTLDVVEQASEAGEPVAGRRLQEWRETVAGR